MAWLKKKSKQLPSEQSDQTAHLAHVTEQMYLKNLELVSTNRMLSLLRTIDTLVLEPSNSVADLAKGITRGMMDNSSYSFCAVFLAHEDTSISFDLKGLSFQNGLEMSEQRLREYSQIRLHARGEWFSSPSQSELLNDSKLSEEYLKEAFGSHAGTVVSLLTELHVKTVSVVKLIGHQHLVGVMLVGIQTNSSDLKVDELSNLGRIGEAAGIAIDSKVLNEKYQQVLKKLQSSNKKLKELDEAKDEFISMASHQLRTPLTSIKGYLSMVLEGDAGKVSKDQEQMLSQAFVSAQRMVYLIADLLNVSRLQTGKFVIEPKDVYLPDVISEELAQLTETAKAKEIAITFDKPKKFPIMQLDDTKIRQVIMNFADNALYYTPAGGHMTIELNEYKSSIELLVIDNGIGVPKAQQHKLFAKFYRADNARKARPDGTGLGLFMAQKVIIASGGSTIFRSQEGKGSTFGFIFPKK